MEKLTSLVREYSATIGFVLRFVTLYVVLNVLYGTLIESYDDSPDPITIAVTRQISNLLGEEANYKILDDAPKVALLNGGDTVINVFEGCNGINTMIVFVAFMFAFGPINNNLIWFIPLGIGVIHLFNLFRLGLLYKIAESYEQYFYYVHKYAFTAIIYLAIFLLWLIWILKFGLKSKTSTGSVSGV